MSVCSKCGANNKPSLTVCRMCSAPLDAKDAVKTPPKQAVHSETATVVISPNEKDDRVVCQACGATNEKEYQFCQRCGTKIDRPGDKAPDETRPLRQDTPGLKPLRGDRPGLPESVREPPPGDPKSAASATDSQECLHCGEFVAVPAESCPTCGTPVGAVQTRVMSAVKPPPRPRLLLVLEGGQVGDEYLLGAHTGIGRKTGEITFPHDDLMSGRHALIEKRGNSFVLKDQGSRNGVFVRIKGEVQLEPGDMVLIGKKLFQFET